MNGKVARRLRKQVYGKAKPWRNYKKGTHPWSISWLRKEAKEKPGYFAEHGVRRNIGLRHFYLQAKKKYKRGAR